tara:strand:- start:429 stop:1121 length:693 start_codon:yes stop_codon:yes gene_type:complete
MQSKLKLKLSKKVFKPTGTSQILLESSLKYIKKNSKILDIGCGSGFIGLSIAIKANKQNKYFFSDISKYATRLVAENAKKNKIRCVIKNGSLFRPWAKEKFDLIVNDVSGISSSLNSICPWYNNFVTNKSGKDGTKFILTFLSHAKNFLNERGVVIFPVISLSNHKKVINFAKRKFKILRKINSREWPLPKEMYKNRKLLERLEKNKQIKLEKKFGILTFKTDIYLGRSN